jgi:hypothetical protein
MVYPNNYYYGKIAYRDYENEKALIDAVRDSLV